MKNLFAAALRAVKDHANRAAFGPALPGARFEKTPARRKASPFPFRGHPVTMGRGATEILSFSRSAFANQG